MANNPFERFPAPFTCMLDKLPPPDEQGRVHLEGHWWRKDRDAVALEIAKLGSNLRSIKSGIEKARKAKDLDAVRAGVAAALAEIQGTLLPILGADALWALTQSMMSLEYAGRRKRHWLVALPKDERHVRRDAPDRLKMQVLAAAMLDYFTETSIAGTQEQVGTKIIGAMVAGSFSVPSNGKRGAPSLRTLQEWRARCLPGSKAKPPDPFARPMFADFLEQLTAKQCGRQTSEYFETCLNDLRIHCWDRAEL